jgi:hypothetical protein
VDSPHQRFGSFLLRMRDGDLVVNADTGILKTAKMRNEIKKPAAGCGRGDGDNTRVLVYSGVNQRSGGSRKICYFEQFINFCVDYASEISYFWECGEEAHRLIASSGTFPHISHNPRPTIYAILQVWIYETLRFRLQLP